MKKLSCRLFAIMAFCAPLTTSAAPLANSTTSKPTLIVWAHTNLENGGAPTLDINDVERYFANMLEEHGVGDVLTSSTVHLPQQPIPNTYLLDVSVNAMRESERPNWMNQTDHVYCVDMSLAVKDLNTGKVLGTLFTRIERSLEYARDDQEQKRSAIYGAAKDLSRSFLSAWAGGEFGHDLPAGQAPSALERAPRWLVVTAAAVALILTVLTIVAIISFVSWLARSVSRLFAVKPEPAPPPEPTPPPQPDYTAWDNELKSAFALALKTESFSEAACHAAAAATRDAILANHTRVEATEAERQLRAKTRERHFDDLATRGAESSGLDTTQIIDILRKAEAWEYRVLQEAKRQAAEASR